jgi:hypothetical protein
VAGGEAAVEIRDGRAVVTVPGLDLAEAVRIDWV